MVDQVKAVPEVADMPKAEAPSSSSFPLPASAERSPSREVVNHHFSAVPVGAGTRA